MGGCTLTFQTKLKVVPIGKATIGKDLKSNLGGLIRGRTGTPLRVPEPKSGASANSAMRPRGVDSTRIASQARAKRGAGLPQQQSVASIVRSKNAWSKNAWSKQPCTTCKPAWASHS